MGPFNHCEISESKSNCKLIIIRRIWIAVELEQWNILEEAIVCVRRRDQQSVIQDSSMLCCAVAKIL